MSLLEKIGIKPADSTEPAVIQPTLDIPVAATPIALPPVADLPQGTEDPRLRASPFTEAAGLPKPRVYGVNDVVRLPNHKTVGGFRVWKITGIYPGALGHESTVGLKPLDVEPDIAEMHVPAILFEACGFEVT